MMPPTTLSGEQPLQPQITKYLDGLRRRNKLKSGVKLVIQCVGQPDETILDVPPEPLKGDLNDVAEDIVMTLQRRADERRVGIRSNLVAQGEEPLFLRCRPTPPSTLASSRRSIDTGHPDVIDGDENNNGNGGGGFDDDDPFASRMGTPKLANQAAQFAMEALGQNRAMFRLTIASALRREERDGRRIMQLEGQVARYQEILDQAVLMREQLLDRQAERNLEIDRVKQKDKWMQDGFAKIVSLIALHAPAILPKFGVQIDPRAREILFDIVGSVAAAKPYVSAMRLAADMADGSGPEPQKTNGVSHTNGTGSSSTTATAGSVAATTIAGNGETVATRSLAVYAAVAVDFISSVRDKLGMVRGVLKPEQTALMDKLLELTDAHGKSFVTIGQAAMQGAAQVTSPAPAPETEEDKKILRLMDLSATFWESLRPDDIEKMRAFLPTKAKEVLDEIGKYGFVATQPRTNQKHV